MALPGPQENPKPSTSYLSESAQEVDWVLKNILYPDFYAAFPDFEGNFVKLANVNIKGRMANTPDATKEKTEKGFLQAERDKISADPKISASQRVIALNWLNKFENGSASE
ncbi:MAG: hypothetical protein WC269_04075 [Candidatus Gracilibacteria bacterium]|jgi:hypothetical protein